MSQRVVPANRPNGSDSYLECSATPDNGAGWAACNKSARTPPTNVAIQPWTCHTALPGPNNPGPDPTAIVLTHSGRPSFEPETFSLNLSASGFVSGNLWNSNTDKW